jgi:hypothetical protein
MSVIADVWAPSKVGYCIVAGYGRSGKKGQRQNLLTFLFLLPTLDFRVHFLQSRPPSVTSARLATIPRKLSLPSHLENLRCRRPLPPCLEHLHRRPRIKHGCVRPNPFQPANFRHDAPREARWWSLPEHDTSARSMTMGIQ